ncbi:MAG: transporter [Pseudomonadales bacterium]|nr:transporter [Pseudomonadales bacterium]
MKYFFSSYFSCNALQSFAAVMLSASATLAVADNHARHDHERQNHSMHDNSQHSDPSGKHTGHNGHTEHRAHLGSHAPIGITGGHTHSAGEWMLSYRAMHMSMRNNRIGGTSIAPETIATTVPNRFAGQPMQPPTLRVVPTNMSMTMHMLGVMFAPSDQVTVMAMTNYQQKSMDHITFMGSSGNTQLGTFTTRSSGVGDSSVQALLKVNRRVHATLGLSLPTGSIKQSDRILTPMNTRPAPRLPYPMQLGSGTYDLITGITYNDVKRLTEGHSSWGAQWRSVLRTGRNDENYSLGDEHRVSAWLSYEVLPSLELSTRLAFLKRKNISGIDGQIVLPVQTADPDRQGAERWDIAFATSWSSPLHKHRLSLEVAAPFEQRLDGPQLKQDYQLTLGWEFLR